MNLTLQRLRYLPYGIFGRLSKENDDVPFLVTLEHAYLYHPEGPYAPIIPQGIYTCIRGQHRLKHSKGSFETFEVGGVNNHYGLLFHVGNKNNESNGCILLGKEIDLEDEMIKGSVQAFGEFLDHLKGFQSFTLNVKN